MNNVITLPRAPRSKRPDSYDVRVFDHVLPLPLSGIETMLSLHEDDSDALAYLDAIPPVQRAWVYRELGA